MTERREYQIHDGTFGLSVYERETAEEALLDFFADRRRGELRRQVRTEDDGSATVTVDGTTFRAVPLVRDVTTADAA